MASRHWSDGNCSNHHFHQLGQTLVLSIDGEYFENKAASGRATQWKTAILDAAKEGQAAGTSSPVTRLGCMHSTVLSGLKALGYINVLTRRIPHILANSMRFNQSSTYQFLFHAPKNAYGRHGCWR